MRWEEMTRGCSRLPCAVMTQTSKRQGCKKCFPARHLQMCYTRKTNGYGPNAVGWRCVVWVTDSGEDTLFLPTHLSTVLLRSAAHCSGPSPWRRIRKEKVNFFASPPVPWWISRPEPSHPCHGGSGTPYSGGGGGSRTTLFAPSPTGKGGGTPSACGHRPARRTGRRARACRGRRRCPGTGPTRSPAAPTGSGLRGEGGSGKGKGKGRGMGQQIT